MLLNLAYNEIFNFSEFPIKFVSRLGLLTILVSLVYLLSVVIKKFYFQEVTEGFTSLLFIVILFSGVQLFALGVIGEYVLRVFFSPKIGPCLL